MAVSHVGPEEHAPVTEQPGTRYARESKTQE